MSIKSTPYEYFIQIPPRSDIFQLHFNLKRTKRHYLLSPKYTYLHFHIVDAIENKFTRMRARFTIGKNCVRFFTDFSADARSEKPERWHI